MVHITDSLLTLMEVGSVEAKSGSLVVCPQICRREILDVSELVRNFQGCYAVNNMTVAFVCENRVFVTPYTTGVRDILEKAGLGFRKFYVPFSDNDEYPLEQEQKWRNLLADRVLVQEKEFSEECERYAEILGIGKLNEEVLKDCMEVPRDGIPFMSNFPLSEGVLARIKELGLFEEGEIPERYSPNYRSVYFPEITSYEFNFENVQRLGKYFTRNNNIVFVYRNGKTYISKFYHVQKALETAGYKKMPMFVPFTNGEIITNLDYKAKWDSLDRW